MSASLVSGVFVSCSCPDDEITLSHKADGNPDSTTNVAGATVTLNGKKADLSDLQAGDLVNLKGSPVTAVEATR